jgi:hypothetical protein
MPSTRKTPIKFKKRKMEGEKSLKEISSLCTNHNIENKIMEKMTKFKDIK